MQPISRKRNKTPSHEINALQDNHGGPPEPLIKQCRSKNARPPNPMNRDASRQLASTMCTVVLQDFQVTPHLIKYDRMHTSPHPVTVIYTLLEHTNLFRTFFSKAALSSSTSPNFHSSLRWTSLSCARRCNNERRGRQNNKPVTSTPCSIHGGGKANRFIT